jgi:hypothetical protein
MRRPDSWMPRAQDARGKVLGARPRTPARGTPPETPGPLSLLSQLPERSSPSRVRSAAHQPRALDRSGPFRISTQIRESGQMQSPLAAGSCLPLVGPELHNNFGVDKPS